MKEPRDPRPAIPPEVDGIDDEDLATIVDRPVLEVSHYPGLGETIVFITESDDSNMMMATLEEQDSAVLLELASYCESIVHSRDPDNNKEDCDEK